MKNILILLSFCLLLKASYLLLSVFLENGKDNKTLFNEYVSIVKKNDSFWYEKITKEGYSKMSSGIFNEAFWGVWKMKFKIK